MCATYHANESIRNERVRENSTVFSVVTWLPFFQLVDCWGNDALDMMKRSSGCAKLNCDTFFAWNKRQKFGRTTGESSNESVENQHEQAQNRTYRETRLVKRKTQCLDYKLAQLVQCRNAKHSLTTVFILSSTRPTPILYFLLKEVHRL